MANISTCRTTTRHAYCACLNTRVDLDLPDGAVYSIKITDDSAGTEVLASTSTYTLPHLYP